MNDDRFISIQIGKAQLHAHELEIAKGLAQIIAKQAGVAIVTDSFLAIVGMAFCAGIGVGINRDEIKSKSEGAELYVVSKEEADRLRSAEAAKEGNFKEPNKESDQSLN